MITQLGDDTLILNDMSRNEILQELQRRIKGEREGYEWDQTRWGGYNHCGFVGCFAGHLIDLCGWKMPGIMIVEDEITDPIGFVKEFFDLEDTQSLWLVRETRTLDDLEGFIEQSINPDIIERQEWFDTIHIHNDTEPVDPTRI